MFLTLAPLLTAFVHRKCCGVMRQHVEDIVQDTLIKAWCARMSLRSYDASDVRPWLLQIANHCVIDWLRKQKRAPLNLTLDAIDHSSKDSPVDTRREESLAKLKCCIAALGAVPRNVIQLRIEGCSYDQIASKLGIDSGTVGSRLSRAKKSLLLCMSREIANTEGSVR